MIQLCEKNECTGCGACFNICPKHAIQMKPSNEGFLYPVIDHEKCIECKLCRKACHIITPVKVNDRATNPLAVLAKSEEIREQSSSGGMFSILAMKILAEGGVVFGAGYGDNYQLFHQKIEKESDLSILRGSKYFQSDIKETYKDVKILLKNKRLVLYTGTPCQIAGLYAYLGNCNIEGLYTIDIVCHGVPSAKSFQAYLDFLVKKNMCSLNDIKDFSFRDLKGWGYSPMYHIPSKDVSVKESPSKNIFMILFLNSFLSRECCFHCKYTNTKRVGDITLADYWGIGTEKPFNYDTAKGCSLVLLNSPKGHDLFESVSERLYYDVREWKEALAFNHQLIMPSKRPKNRGQVYNYLANHTFVETYNHFINTPYLRARRVIGNILRMLHFR